VIYFLILELACGVESADIVVKDGTIYVDAETTNHAMAVTDGVVVAHDALAETMIGPQTQVVDLEGGFVVPGFHDAHVHLLAGSFVLNRLVLMGVSSMDSIISGVQEYALDAPDEPWIIGYGWVHAMTADPSGVALDAVVSDRPALIIDSSGHAALINTVAMDLAGIDATTPDPEGGEIVRDPKTGQPTGLLLEDALSLVSDLAIEAYDDELLAGPLRDRLMDFRDAGITSVSEIMASPGFNLARPWLYQDLEAAGELPLRVFYYVPIFRVEDVVLAAQFTDVWDGDLVVFAGGKVWVDGSMGTGQSWVNEPLKGTDSDYGSHYFDVDELTEIVSQAEAHGLALKFHVNGDAAVSATLDALESVAVTDGLDQQHVLEHVVLISDYDRDRLNTLGLVASVQPSHALVAEFGESADLWGDRFDAAYDFQMLAESGAQLAIGTDWPVWPTLHAPTNLWAAVTAQSGPLTTRQAFDAYTTGGAAAVGRQGSLGCLMVGCEADWVVMDGDLLGTDANDLANREIEAVYVAGTRMD